MSPKMPAAPAPVELPDPEDPNILAARRKKMADIASRDGRNATDLTKGGATGAGGDYSRTLLG